MSDMNKVYDFNERCYALLDQIPAGKVTTYGEIARALGSRAWRAVGSAMAGNRHLVVVPCHRVVRSDGAVGQYAQGAERKVALLRSEGVEIENGKIAGLNRFMHRFDAGC